MKLARTVVSELGDNGEMKAHFQMFQDVIAAVGIELDDWTTVKHIPEAESSGQRNSGFIPGTAHQLRPGRSLRDRRVRLPMIVNLYEGFRNYKGWKHVDYLYFYLHLLVEANHVDWIGDAVLDAAKTPADADQIREGAKEILGAVDAVLERP